MRTVVFPEQVPEPVVITKLRAAKNQIDTALWAAQDFLKHARNEEPDSIHELNPFWTEIYLFLTIRAYTWLTLEDKEDDLLMIAFAIHFAIRWPDLFGPNPLPSLERHWDIETLKNLDKKAFLKKALGDFALPPGLHSRNPS